MAAEIDTQRLTSPKIFLIGMTSFLVIVGFVALMLFKPMSTAFEANPGLNSLIIGVLALGSVFAYRQVFRLFREIDWVNSLVAADAARVRPPLLLGPMATLLNAGAGARRPVHPYDAGESSIPSAPGSTRGANSTAISSACWCFSACSALSGVCCRRFTRSAG